MRFYIEKKGIQNDDFEKVQVDFLKEYKIKHLFTTQDTKVSELLKSHIKIKIVDSLSNKVYYFLDF